MCIGAGVFCLLPHCIVDPHLFNIAATYSLSNLCKQFHRDFNLLLNTRVVYFSIVCNLCKLGFACALVFLCVCIVFVLCTA